MRLPTIPMLLLFLAGCALADLPRKAPLTKYQHLWQNSPFTTKPVSDGGPPPPNPLDDYSLLGVAPVKGGHRVTIINKKDPQDRKFVYTNKPDASHGFEIISVERDPKDMRATVVRMRSGNLEGTVTYEEQFLTLTPPPQMAQPAVLPADRERSRQNRGNPTEGNQPQPNNPGQAASVLPAGALRAERPRVVGQPQLANPGQAAGSNVPPAGSMRAERPRVIGPSPLPDNRPSGGGQSSSPRRDFRR